MTARTVRRRVRRRLAALCAAVAPVVAGGALLLAASPASAHAELVTSTPADGATVAVAPASLALRLSEAVVPGTTVVTLTDGTGRTVPLHEVAQSQTAGGGPARIYRVGDPGAPTTVTVELPPGLLPDVYRVRWTTLSAADMHNTSGVVVFGVRRSVTGARASVSDPMPPGTEVVLRWLGLLGAGAAAGALVVRGLAARPAAALPGPVLDTLARAAAAAGLLAAGAGPLLLAVQATASGAPLGRLLAAGGYGLRWGLQETAAVLLLLLAARAVRTPSAVRDPRGRAQVVGLLTLYAVGTAVVGHGGAGGLRAPVRLLADVVHVAAALGWCGLLVGVAVVGSRRAGRAAWRPVLLGIGRWAGASVAALTVTGLLLMASQVATPDALLLSTYGRLLLGKVVVALVGGAAALVTISVLRPGLPLVPPVLRRPVRSAVSAVARRAGLRGLVLLEAGALVVVLLAAAGVASSRPADGTEWIPSSEGVPLRSGQAKDVVETLKVSPNRPGRNFVTADLFSQYLPPPGPIERVEVVLTRPGAAPVTVPMRQDAPLQSAQILGDNSPPWVGVTDGLDTPGEWTATLVVHRGGAGTLRTAYPWLVEDPRARLRAPVVSSARWASWLEGLAALLATGLVAARAGTAARRRRSLAVPMAFSKSQLLPTNVCHHESDDESPDHRSRAGRRPAPPNGEREVARTV